MLVENIPDDLSLHSDGRLHLPLSVAFHSLLDQAKHSIEVVSSVWDLTSWDMEPPPNTAKQVMLLHVDAPVCALERLYQWVLCFRVNFCSSDCST